MYAPQALLLAALICGLCWRCIASLRERQARWRKEAQYSCKPVRILSATGWLSGPKHARETLVAYRSGTRNRQLQERHRFMGNTFRTHSRSQIFTIDLENVKAAFGGSFREWGVEPIRLTAFWPLTGGGTLTTDGDVWKHARGLCQTNLNWIQKFRNSDLSCYDSSIQRLIETIPANGTTMDMTWLFCSYMIDSSTAYLLGDPIGALLPGPEGEAGREFLKAFLHGIEAVGERNEAWQLTDIYAKREFREACKTTHKLIDHYVQQAIDDAEGLDGKPPADASLALLWAMVTKDPVEIRNQILNVLVAAFDTTAITLTHAVFHLARHPECYRKLRDEALAWNGEELTGSNIKSMRYLRAVIDETLRLNTPATFNSRVALHDTKLPKGGGSDGQCPVFVPKGGVVSTSIYSIQRDPEVYGKDADSFRPERWEEVQPKPWQYIPFSAGPRVCPGQNLAIPQSCYVLFRIARRFSRLEDRDPTWELVEKYKVSTSSRNGAKVAWYTD